MSYSDGFAADTTNGEVTYSETEFTFAREVFNLISEEAANNEPPPRIEANAPRGAQLKLF